MDAELLLTIGSILLLIVFSAFFSGSETALTGSSYARMHQLDRKGEKRAHRVLALREHSETMIGAILIGNNITNILSSVLATTVFLHFFGETGVAYATLVMTVIVVIFAEVLPKTYALNNSDRVALAVAPLVSVIVFIFSPISKAVRAIVRGILALFGVKISEEFGHSEQEEELRGLIELHGHRVEVDEEEVREERAMLRSILDLSEVWVEEIMTHRRRVEMLDADDTLDNLISQVMKSPYTRLPLFKGDHEEIVGVLHAKAVLRAVKGLSVEELDKLDIRDIASDPWFIPSTTTLLDQLQAFRARREHFALVIDEYGAFQGIVTLEDIIEEIVGDISDEHDVAVAGVRPQPDGSYVIDGTVTLRDLNREFDWNLPDEEASTIAGLVLHEARTIPNVSQEFVFHGFRFKILRRHRNQITLLRISPEARVEAEKEATETRQLPDAS
ncbi:MAG: HlyC/CorC family transporter [Nisaea sp.]|jgi:Mg2+/Co2+ transporter CorB|uniref:HlyC/CorC family transporter n=1 Tax=Nisaea sp. TaxID=2024842 RepID=UPI001B2D4235|nr:HlyC/CorC family transporter [Nisaea sp.]MBO6560853.1 HlyC/CorC family transporter [Nisaea sp.]